MAYTMTTEGLDNVEKMFREMGEQAGKVASYALYEGAGVMVEEVNRQAKSIVASKFHYAVFPPTVQRLPSAEEKAAVVSAGAGIAKFQKDLSEVQTSVGYGNAGYATIAGKVKPIPLIVNSIHSGTSFMKKQPFVRRAASVGKSRTIDTIVASVDKQYQEIINKSGG